MASFVKSHVNRHDLHRPCIKSGLALIYLNKHICGCHVKCILNTCTLNIIISHIYII